MSLFLPLPILLRLPRQVRLRLRQRAETRRILALIQTRTLQPVAPARLPHLLLRHLSRKPMRKELSRFFFLPFHLLFRKPLERLEINDENEQNKAFTYAHEVTAIHPLTLALTLRLCPFLPSASRPLLDPNSHPLVLLCLSVEHGAMLLVPPCILL